jgi:hypothetical protein
MYRAELMRSAVTEPDMDLRAAAFEILVPSAPDAELARFARAEIDRVESWKVRAAIAALVAKADPEAAFEFLARELDVRSTHGAYEARILPLIAATQDPRAPALLEALARDASRPDEARVSAVRELGRRADDADAVATLCDLLESPRFRVRREVLQALTRLRDSRTRAALTRFRDTTAIERDRYAAEDALARITTAP